MRKHLFLGILLLIACGVQAQHITRNYNKTPLPYVLTDIDNASQRYTINFIYNELEDFTVTANLRNRTVPEAVREVLGFYPMRMTVSDSIIFVECTQKSPAKVIGHVVDQHSQPVPFANVALLNPSDSGFINGGVTNNGGDFVIPCSQRKVLLRVSFVGFATYCKLVNVGNIGTVRMKPDAYRLKAVTVKGMRRVIKNDVDRLQYLVGNDPFSKGMNGIEVMGRVPMLTVSDEIVSIVGKGSTHIMLDGHILEMTADAVKAKLRSLKAEDIERIEVITIPPAKYKAEANAGYINVVMKRDQSKGWSGSISEEVQRQYRGRYFQDINLNYAGRKLELSTGLGMSLDKVINESYCVYAFKDGHQRSTRKRTIAPWPSYNADAIVKYHATRRLELGVMASVYADHTSPRHTFVSINKDTTFTTAHAPAVWNDNVSTTLYAEYRLDSLEKTVSLNYNIFNSNAPTQSENVSVTNGMTESLRNESKAKYQINALKLDFSLPFKHLYMETGVSFSAIRNKTSLMLENFANGKWKYNAAESNEFLYKERTLAAYLSVKKQLTEKLQVQAGLRYEHTWTESNQLTQGQISRSHYGRFYPTLHLNWQLKGNQNLAFAADWGIERPDFNDLNPFRIYTSTTDYMTGNPYLAAAYTRNMEINYSNGKGLYVVLYSSHGKGETGWRTTFLANGSQVTGPYDGLRHEKTGVYANYNRNVLAWMNLNIGGEVYYYDSHSDYQTDVLQINGWGRRAEGSLSFLLNRQKTLIAEINYRHWFREYFAQTQSDPHAYLRMSLKYSCLDDRLKMSLTIGDPFHQNINRNTIFYQEYTNTNRFDNHSRYIGFRAAWSFGGRQVHRTYHDNRDTESQRAK
ncbi:MAG: outer membrane beta-barrel protein [Prevotella denticola]